MRYIQPTIADMLSTLPPAEQAELLTLIGRAAAEQAAERILAAAVDG